MWRAFFRNDYDCFSLNKIYKFFKERTLKKTLVLGIGNYLMGDEGIGVHLINSLENETFPSHIEIMDGGTGGFHLLGPMQEVDKLVLIDASCDTSAEGTIRKIVPKFAGDYPPTLTAHDIGLKDLLDAFYITEKVPEVILFAITIKPLTGDLSTDLTPAIQAILPELKRQVIQEALNS